MGVGKVSSSQIFFEKKVKTKKNTTQANTSELSQSLSSGKPKKRVLIIDDFDRQEGKLISHGGASAAIIQSAAKRNGQSVDITRMDTPKVLTGESLLKILEKVETDVKNGVQYDAINLSWGKEVKVHNLELAESSRNSWNAEEELIAAQEEAGIEPDPTRERGFSLALHKARIKLKNLVKSGIPVYIAAGNDGKGYTNALAVKGAHIVGATTQDGTVISSSDSKLKGTTRMEYGELQLDNLIKDKKTGQEGYDINNDGIVDFSKDAYNFDQDNDGIPDVRTRLEGTSYATPEAVGADLFGRHEKGILEQIGDGINYYSKKLLTGE